MLTELLPHENETNLKDYLVAVRKRFQNRVRKAASDKRYAYLSIPLRKTVSVVHGINLTVEKNQKFMYIVSGKGFYETMEEKFIDKPRLAEVMKNSRFCFGRGG